MKDVVYVSSHNSSQCYSAPKHTYIIHIHLQALLQVHTIGDILSFCPQIVCQLFLNVLPEGVNVDTPEPLTHKDSVCLCSIGILNGSITPAHVIDIPKCNRGLFFLLVEMHAPTVDDMAPTGNRSQHHLLCNLISAGRKTTSVVAKTEG